MLKKIKTGKKGIALFIVLMTVLVVVLLANIIITITSSQSHLTHHQAGRTQAYYAALAGVNYAIERLRRGAWTYAPANSCPNPGGCIVNENAFPHTILSFDASTNRQFKIIFCPPAAVCDGAVFGCSPPAGLNFCINSTVTYANP